MTDLAQVVDLDLDHLTPAERSQRARDAYRASGCGLSAEQLATRFDRSRRWGQDRIAEVRSEDAAAAAEPRAVPRPEAATAADPAVDGRELATPRRAAAATVHAPAANRLPLSFRVVTLGSVAVVAAVCATASYVHLHDLVAAAGGGWLAWPLPLGIDGMAVAGATVLIAHHRYGGQRRTRTFAVLAVALGLFASVAANVAAVDPALVDLRHVRWCLAGYPPLGLALVSDLAFAMIRTESAD